MTHRLSTIAILIAGLLTSSTVLAQARIEVRADVQTIHVGETAQINVLGVAPGLAQPINVTRAAQWSETCGIVDASGRFHAPDSPGSCTVTATVVSSTGQRLSGSVTFRIVPPAVPPPIDTVTLAVPEINAQRNALEKEAARLRNLEPPSIRDSTRSNKGWLEIPVYFGTRRKIGDGSGPDRFFIGGDAQKMTYGVAAVSIPEGLRPGSDDTRGLCRYFGPIVCPHKPSNTVTILAVDTSSEAAWLRRLQGDMATDTVDALVFVHGYNNSFKDAVTRTAKLAYSIGFPGIAMAFDWSSQNSVPGYVADLTAAQQAVPDFKRFLTRLADSTRVRRIAIVAHSMGTSLVSNALKDLATERPSLSFGPIVLAAADMDSSIFVDQLATFVASRGKPVTIYASTKDRVIWLSSHLSADHRVGSGPPTVILLPGIDYVDASIVETDALGHGYFVENRDLLNDITILFQFRVSASQRRDLATISLLGSEYYRIR